MAENLGTAVLRLEVDDTALREGLAQARRLIEGTSVELGRQTRSGSSSRSTSPAIDFSKTVRAERQLATERSKTTAESLKASKAELQQQQVAAKRRKDILSNAIIGGAFPALFGQGLGASFGGAAGGAAGGAIGGQFGFGLSLVGTALGAQVDLAIQKFRDLSKALDDPIKNFELLVQNASLSSKQVEKYARALIDSGRNAEAAAFIQEDLISTFGSLQGAREYNSAIDTLNRSWSRATTVLAGFVAGPLSALIRQLEQPTGGAAVGLSFEQLAGQLTPGQFRQVQARREQVTESSRQARGGISSFLPPSNDDVNRGLKAGAELAEQLLGIEKQRADLAERVSFAQVLNQKALSTSYELITASTQGYQQQVLEKQKEVALNERNIKLLELTAEQRQGPQGEKIQQDTALRIYELDLQINDLRKERLATASLEQTQNRLALAAVQERIAAARQLGSLEEGVARSTLETALNVRASVAEAKRREQEIGAQIDGARIRGGDAGEAEASRLVGEQRVAAEETKLKLIEGATALRDAGVRLRKDLDSAFLNLQRLRTGSGGLNQFLGGQDRARREEDVFQALLPRLRQAQGTFARLTGVRAPEFSGPTSSVNQTILQFIDAVKAEEQALTNTVDTQRALSDNTAALATITGELRTVMGQLTEKNWAVNVSVAADGSSQAYGDVLNGALAS